MAKTIMIVDDSASMRRVVGISLKAAGYEVLEGCDGQDALLQSVRVPMRWASS